MSPSRRPVRARHVVAAVVGLLVAIAPVLLIGSTQPIRARRAMVVSQDEIASRVGDQVMRDGGNAIDAAATAVGRRAPAHQPPRELPYAAGP